LLKKLCKIDGIKWIRLMYCYEDEITDELIKVIKSEDKIVKYIDIPVQHGSTKILKAMNRKSTKESIEATVNKLRDEIPGIVIRTTLITGFPGETAKEFDELYDFVCKMKFDRLGVFAYSKEEGTKAAKMKGQVRSDVKERRRDKIMELQRQISLENNKKYIGNTIEVLVEEIDEDGSYVGRASFDAEGIDNGVIFTSKKKLKVGQFVNVLVTDAFDYDLCGEVK
ncbi:MAG: radical SAM protein, partial [Clostridia bacterium]|nr:radical SAM protein [Clostridia bacterium]